MNKTYWQENYRGIFKNHKWLISLAINSVILVAILLLTDLSYETNDDYAIAQEIVAGYPYVGFVNYYLCKILISAQGYVANINIFMLSQILASYIAFVVLMKVYINRAERSSEIILATLICGFFSFDHYSCLQFTKTASILMIAGLLWAVDNYVNERKTIPFIAAFLLYYIGVAYRQKGMFPAIAYAGIFVMLWLMQNKTQLLKKERFAKELCLLLFMLVVLIIPYGIDKVSDAKNAETPELEYARDYQAERVLVTDYPLMDYESNRDRYDEVGINELDLFLIDRWILDYDGAASIENLRAINEINRPYVKTRMTAIKAVKQTAKGILSYVHRRSFSGMHIIILIALTIFYLCSYQSKSWGYIFAIGTLTIAIYIAIHYMQRAQYRALYIAEASAAFWILYAAIRAENRKKRPIKMIALCLTITTIAFMVRPAIHKLEERCKKNSAAVESEAILNYYNNHKDMFFVVPTTIAGMPKAYEDPLAIPETLVNVTDTGGWDTLTPYRIDALKKCGGINNPIKDLVNNPKGVYVGSYKLKEMTDYYNKWYSKEGTTIEFVKFDRVDDLDLYKVIVK